LGLHAQSQRSDQQRAQVYFAPNTELATMLAELTKNGLPLLAFQRRQPQGTQLWTDEFSLDQVVWQTSTDLTNQYWQSHAALRQDLLASYRRLAAKRIEDPAWQALVDSVPETFIGCWESSSCPTIIIYRITTEGSPQSLQNLAQSTLVDRVDQQTTSNSAPAQVNPVLWRPQKGDVDIQPSSVAGERYINNTMYWGTTAGFTANSAYEHDFFLNNSEESAYGPGTYLTADQSLTGIPTVAHWTSNLPSPYLDTRFEDPDFVRSYTIGAADGAAIVADTWYTSLIRAANGEADIDNGYLQAQLGHRTPPDCYSTWCVFGDQIVDIYPAYAIDPVPGQYSWQFYSILLPVIERGGPS
jgi:hypothetical protein